MIARMRSSLRQALLIVLLGLGLGVLFNAASPQGIPFITPPKAPLNPEELITLEQAKEAWQAGATFFLDARATADFAAGHIANAFNLPADAFDEHWPQIAPMLSVDAPLVVYCDGEECELSHRLKDKLGQAGYAKVKILLNGWTVWRKAGLATLSGSGQ